MWGTALGLPPSSAGGAIYQRIPGWATVTNTQWQPWRRPRGKTMMSGLLLSGGGGGGGGFTAAAAAARGGGGAGGSSGAVRFTMPLAMLPELLYIQVGAGGAGGAAGGAGSAGILSYIAVAPDTTAANVLAVSGAAAPGGGGAGTGAAAGTAGAAGTIPTLAAMPLNPGVTQLIAGQAGTAGGAQTGAVGAAQTIPVTSCLAMGGTGGGGVTAADFAGGLITAITNSYISERRPQNAAAGSFDGSGGHTMWEPFFSFGGLGGGSSNTGPGGAGGPGGYGAGGGGGGGGTTGGAGGAGGPGLLIIVCW